MVKLGLWFKLWDMLVSSFFPFKEHFLLAHAFDIVAKHTYLPHTVL